MRARAIRARLSSMRGQYAGPDALAGQAPTYSARKARHHVRRLKCGAHRAHREGGDVMAAMCQRARGAAWPKLAGGTYFSAFAGMLAA